MNPETYRLRKERRGYERSEEEEEDDGFHVGTPKIVLSTADMTEAVEEEEEEEEGGMKRENTLDMGSEGDEGLVEGKEGIVEEEENDTGHHLGQDYKTPSKASGSKEGFYPAGPLSNNNSSPMLPRVFSETNIDRDVRRRSSVSSVMSGGVPAHPHEFGQFKFTKPSKCHVCDKFIWGFIRPGVRCINCNFDCHKDCVANVLDNCGLPSEKGSALASLVTSVSSLTMLGVEQSQSPVPGKESSLSPQSHLDRKGHIGATQRRYTMSPGLEASPPRTGSLSATDSPVLLSRLGQGKTERRTSISSLIPGRSRSRSASRSNSLRRSAGVSGSLDSLVVKKLQRSRSKKHRNIHYVNGHEFYSKAFQLPNFCDHCDDFIWNVGKNAFCCQKCRLVVHRKCHKNVLNCHINSEDRRRDENSEFLNVPDGENMPRSESEASLNTSVLSPPRRLTRVNSESMSPAQYGAHDTSMGTMSPSDSSFQSPNRATSSEYPSQGSGGYMSRNKEEGSQDIVSPLTQKNLLAVGSRLKPRRPRAFSNRSIESEMSSEFSDAGSEMGDVVRSAFLAEYDFEADVLGSGKFGVVKGCVSKLDGMKYAVKIVNKRRFLMNKRVLNELITEVEILKSLSHPNVVYMKDFFEENRLLFIVMEYVPGGDLLEYLAKRGRLNVKESQIVFRQIAKAVNYLHGKGIVHRDLKPENILIGSASLGKAPLAASSGTYNSIKSRVADDIGWGSVNNLADKNEPPPPNDFLAENIVIKLADFGFAKLVEENTVLKTVCGTPAFVAPEIMLQQKATGTGYSNKVDVWSIGVMLFLALSGSLPFDSIGDLAIQLKDGSLHFDEEVWSTIPENARDLVEMCLVIEPEDRVSVSEILESPFLAS